MRAKTFGALFVLLIIMTLSFGCRSIARNPNRNNVVQYRVAAIEDISIGQTRRYVWEVVVEEQANVNQLRDLATTITEQAKRDMSFNALAIAFYDYEEYIGHGYTLGKVEYAPDGNWEKAPTVQTGQYDNMEYQYHLKEKDWDTQLTQEEVEIFVAWHELFNSRLTPDNIPEEEGIAEEVAQEYNIQSEEVDRILIKQITWTVNDTQPENIPGNQPANQPTNQPRNIPANKPVNQPRNHPTNQPGKPCC